MKSHWLAMALLLAAPAFAARPAPQGEHRSVEVVADAAGRLRPAPSDNNDFAAAQRYWTDPQAGTLLRGHAHTLDAEVVAAQLDTPYGLGFDAEAQRFLWTSSGAAAVQTLAYGQSEVRSLQSSFEQPATLEMAQESGRQALSLDGDRVVRVSEDAISGATTTEVLAQLEPGLAPHGLALDAEAGVVYVGNAVGMMVYRLRLADNRLERLAYVDNAPPVADLDPEELP